MIRFYRSQYPQENVVIEALYDGCDEPKSIHALDEYEASEVAVVMGVYKKNVPASFKRGNVIARQKESGGRVLVLETGYINRGAGPQNHYALGWDGLNGRADFRNAGSPPDRAEKLGIELKERRYGSEVILCGQVPWDASVDFSDHQSWLRQSAGALLDWGYKVVFRPHPLAVLPNIPGCSYSVGGALVNALHDAHCVVTFNSNSGVEAAIDGVPVIAVDQGAMVWPIANHSLMAVQQPMLPNRQQWLNDIAYAQWTPDEMRSGEAWNHIARKH